MTDEERKEAEKLAEKTLSSWNDVTGLVSMRSSYYWELHSLLVDMYASACEAKRAEVHKHKTAAAVFREMIEAERARSAKLVEVLFLIVKRGYTGAEYVARQAIYELKADMGQELFDLVYNARPTQKLKDLVANRGEDDEGQ